VPGGDGVQRASHFQATHRAQPGLAPAVISFDTDVRVLLEDVPRGGAKSSSTRGQTGARSAVTSIGDDLDLSARVKKCPRSSAVAVCADRNVDDVTVLVDGREQVGPTARTP
jgi:hypothetical protein